jgi:uncharacterized membrane protein
MDYAWNEGVKKVTQLDDQRLHWEAEIAGKDKEWDARITDQVPDQLIAWQSEGGEYTSGTVNFAPVDQNRTHISLQLLYDPEGFVEKAGDTLGVVSSQVEGDLERFKEFIAEMLSRDRRLARNYSGITIYLWLVVSITRK